MRFMRLIRMQGPTVEYGVVQSQNRTVTALVVVEIGGMTCVWPGEKRWAPKVGVNTTPTFT